LNANAAHRELGLKSHHYCVARHDDDGMEYMAVRERDQLEGDAKEKEKLSSCRVIGLESHHQYDDHEVDYMDVRKRLQFEEDAQEKEKMTESSEYDLDDDLDDDLDIVRKWLQLGKDTQEKEKMIESGEWDSDNDFLQVG